MKYFLGVLFVLVLLALGAGGFFMLRRDACPTSKNKKMAWALTLRVALSILVFVLIWASYSLHWITPTGVIIKH